MLEGNVFDTTYKNAQKRLEWLFYEPSPSWRSVFFYTVHEPFQATRKATKSHDQSRPMY